jgi:hypothetical protein
VGNFLVNFEVFRVWDEGVCREKSEEAKEGEEMWKKRDGVGWK